MTELTRPGRPSTRQPGRPEGRPSVLHQVIDHDANGRPITSRERFLAIITTGEPVTIAAECAGLTKHTVTRLLNHGALLAHYVHAGRRNEPDLTRHEQDLLQFSRDFTTASSRGLTRLAALRARIMQGGTVLRTTTTTTRQTDNGTPETTTVVREEVLGPSERMLMWHAERTRPDAYGSHLRVILDPPAALFDPTDEDRVGFLMDDAAAWLAENPGDDVIDVEVRDEPA